MIQAESSQHAVLNDIPYAFPISATEALVAKAHGRIGGAPTLEEVQELFYGFGEGNIGHSKMEASLDSEPRGTRYSDESI